MLSVIQSKSRMSFFSTGSEVVALAALMTAPGERGRTVLSGVLISSFCLDERLGNVVFINFLNSFVHVLHGIPPFCSCIQADLFFRCKVTPFILKRAKEPFFFKTQFNPF